MKTTAHTLHMHSVSQYQDCAQRSCDVLDILHLRALDHNVSICILVLHVSAHVVSVYIYICIFSHK